MTDAEYENSFYGIHPRQIVPGTLFVSRDPSTCVNLLVLGDVHWICSKEDRRDWAFLSDEIHWSVYFTGLHGETGEKHKFCAEGAQKRYYDEIVWDNYYILLPTGNEP